MKKIVSLLLGLCSLVGFAQSDLEVEPISVANGLFTSPNYRYNPLLWSFNAHNNGTTEASIVPYNIYLSEDNVLDPSDLLVHTGSLGEGNSNSPSSGIDGNSTVLVQSYLVTEKDFYIPWNYEANEDYFFIFEIEQDVDGGETNMANNTVAVPYYLSLSDKLNIQHVDYTVELGSKTPLLLVHGWQPDGYNAIGKTSIWDNFLEYFNNDAELTQNFKPYYVQYYSNIIPANDLGHELRAEFDNWFASYTGNINIVAHSMGGLVSRSFMNREIDNIKVGDRVNKLITLGTPHHGSPMANGPIRLQANTQTPYIISSVFLNALDHDFYGSLAVGGTAHQEYNRWDLRWDNYDGYWSEGVYSTFIDEHNDWLNSDKMNLDVEFDDKIIAYGGFITERSLFSISPNLTSAFYFLVEPTINLLGFPLNDGIVPYQSATFEGHELNKIRLIPNRFHDEMAKGRFDFITNSGTDETLFGLIKTDLLDNVSNAIITPSLSFNYVYPETAIGNTSTKEIIVSNTGDLNLIINTDDIQLIGADNMQFDFDFPTETITILPNETETLVVDFSPNTIGEKTVTFRVNNSSANNPQLDIQLSGLAVETAATDYNTNTDPEYDFGDVYIYGGTELVTLTVSNSSSAPYTVAGLDIVGPDADLFTIVQQPTLPILFNSGDSETIIISFDPDTVGEKTAMIEASFQNNAILDTANLIGNGVNTITNPNAPKLSSYEYWFNDDYSSRQAVELTSSNSIENINFNANTTNISNGLNKFHFRVKDEEGLWSSISSDYIYVQNATASGTNNIVEYEYWYNNNYANKVSGNAAGTNPLILNLDANMTLLDKGLHQFHVRFKDEKGAWSSIVSEFIYNNNPGGLGFNAISAYRYWFNEDFDNRVSQTVSQETTYMFLEDINISGLPNNTLNYIHFQFKDIFGNWSSVLTEEFLFATLGFEDANAERLKLYPNPSNSIIYLKLEVENGQLTIYDNLGKLVKEYSSLPTEVDISLFENGLYFFQLKTDDKIYQEKVIKF